jgi:hypothetical protein
MLCVLMLSVTFKSIILSVLMLDVLETCQSVNSEKKFYNICPRLPDVDQRGSARAGFFVLGSML